MFLHTCLLSLAFQECIIYSSNAWRIKGWSNSCLSHTSSQKNIYGRFQQLFITETAKFHCSMIKISGFTGVFMNFDMCLCWWWMKHSINDHTTQHNIKSSRGFFIIQWSSDTHRTLSLALTGAWLYQNNIHMCDVSAGANNMARTVASFSGFEKVSKCNVFAQIFRCWKFLLARGRRKCIYMLESTLNPR